MLTEDIPGWSVASDNGLTVALDINVTDDLRKEGLARELVNRVQNIRKDMGLDVQDKIEVLVSSQEDLVRQSIMDNHSVIIFDTLEESYSKLKS